LAVDTPAALRQRLYDKKVVFHLSDVSAEYLQLVNGFEFVHGVEQVDKKLVVALEEPEMQNPILVRALVENGAEVQFVGELRRSLEDVYLQLVG
jgi:ABC-2 type transport system ATP-binding protein